MLEGIILEQLFFGGNLVTPDRDVSSSRLPAKWRNHSSNQSLTFCLSPDPCVKLRSSFPVKSLK